MKNLAMIYRQSVLCYRRTRPK